MATTNFERLIRNAAQSNNSRANGSNEPFEKAEFWMNTGLEIQLTREDGTIEKKFLSLAKGIPLDKMAKLDTSSSNEDYAMFQQGRNDLYDHVMEIARKLQPGESKIVDLQVEVRRTKSELPAPKLGSNPYVAAIRQLVA
jgi:hypothetical protein